MKYFIRTLFLLVFLVVFLTTHQNIQADEIDDINAQISTLQRDLDSSLKATKPLEEDIARFRAQIEKLHQKTAQIEANISQKETLLANSASQAADIKDKFDSEVLNHYTQLYTSEGALTELVFSPNFNEAMQQIFINESRADESKEQLLLLFAMMNSAQEQKSLLESERSKLFASKGKIEEQSKKLESVVGEAKQYQKSLTNKIASLSAKQQALLAAKLGSLNLPTSLGAGPLFCTDDRKIDPGFGEGFAAFTFGIPHRVGMNQYGALGRAKAGKNYREILDTYFTNMSIEKRDPNMKIRVKGYGDMTLETYLLGIYEMPGSWPLEALKAQVVAARSYALAYTKNGNNEICTTQACQVYKGGNKGGDWEKAVRDTEGEVMVSGGTVVTGWFASTSGGYTFTSGDVGWNNKPWTKRLRDTDGDVGSFDDLFARAFDKESPCFYAAQGARKEYNKSAWLRPEELADIVNVLILAKTDANTQTHLSQVDKGNPDGTDTWDSNRVKQELRSRGKNPYSRITNANVSADFGVGKINSVSFSGDAGSESFDGQEFRTFFNLRAPGSIQIVGPLYRFEKR